MRLLTEDMPVPAVNMPALTSKMPKEALVTEPGNPVVLEAEPIENRNLTLARQVEKYKKELVQQLSNYPVVAMWLLEKYDSFCPGLDGDEESSPPSGLDEYIQPLKADFQKLQSCVTQTDSNELSFKQAISRLNLSTSEFPFAFEDLKQVVNLIIGILPEDDFAAVVADYPDAKSREIIRKRIESYQIAKTKESTLLKSKSKLNYRRHEKRLLLSADEARAIMGSLILTEQSWLFYRQQLATVNTKLVLFIANQYKGSFLDFEDLVQEGQSGLLKAVDRFKYHLGYQFSTYAGYWIRQAISRALSRSERVVRIPCGQVALINRVFKTKEELLQKTGKEPSVKEIAEHINMPEEEVYNIVLISQGSVSLESFDEEEDDNSFAPIDFVEQDIFSHSSEMIAENQLHGLVDAAIKTLNPREAKIINSHFGMASGEQKTLQQIGSELNLTRERVRQIQVVALNKIKMRYGEHLLSFL